jgi:hypothetical protein
VTKCPLWGTSPFERLLEIFMTSEDLELIREIVLHGGTRYTAGNIDHRYRRLIDFGWVVPVVMDKTATAYEATDEGWAAAA